MATTTRNGAFIGGEWVAGDGEEIEVRSPATGELLGTVVASTPAQVDAAVKAAAVAFTAWRRTSVLERVEICRRAFQLCLERNEEIAQMITREVGKNDPVILICRTGNRTSHAQKFLQAQGFTRVYNVKEGMAGSAAGPGWLKRALPVESCMQC